jgi:hypothetical protein
MRGGKKRKLLAQLLFEIASVLRFKIPALEIFTAQFCLADPGCVRRGSFQLCGQRPIAEIAAELAAISDNNPETS